MGGKEGGLTAGSPWYWILAQCVAAPLPSLVVVHSEKRYCAWGR